MEITVKFIFTRMVNIIYASWLDMKIGWYEAGAVAERKHARQAQANANWYEKEAMFLASRKRSLK